MLLEIWVPLASGVADTFVNGHQAFSPAVCANVSKSLPYFCEVFIPLRMDGYQMIALGRWDLLIQQYSISSVILFAVGFSGFSLYRRFLDLYFREKQQRERMKMLPGVYK